MKSDEGMPENALEMVPSLNERQRLRVEVIQELMAAPDQATYRQRQQLAAERLDLSFSSIQRLVREWKQKEIAGLSWRNRSNRGQFRIPENWQTFLLLCP